MKHCEGDGDCEAQPDAECLACLLCLSDLEIKAFGRFLDEQRAAMRAAGLSLSTIDSIINAATV